MPNTIQNLKDIKIAQSALQPWMNALLPLRAFSTNFSPEAAEKLDAVKVPIVGAPGASSDFAGSYLANIDSNLDSIPVVLNRHKFQTFHVTAREMAETALPVLETLIQSKAQKLAEDVLLDIWSIVTAANYGTPAIDPLLAPAFDYKKVLKIREECGKAKMPRSPRAMILDSGYYTNLLADEVVAKSFNLTLSGPGVVEAQVRRLAGFDLYETTVIPSEHPEKLVGFAAHPSSIAIAMRYLQPVANYEEAGAVTDPETGLTFGYLRYTETQSNRIFITLECLYGFSVAIAAGIKRIVKP